MKEPLEKGKALQQIKNILTGVPLENPEMPGGSRVLKNDLNEIATEIIKIMVLHTFTTTDLDIVLSLVRYRITGQWVDLTSLGRSESDAIGFITSNDIVPVDCNSESNFCHTFLGLTQSKKV